ncbi:MAG TPA: carbon-nitrogen hydrolase family protein [Pseudonocardiaceae bacterium]|jgi:predicted amidohydrolase|nr:carbon-nitrogen hydrolase family protein [Pseudonocardiaceae bacterium]
MSRSLPIALVQAEPVAGADVDVFAADVTAVLGRFPGTALVVYPELHLFGGDGDETDLAEPLSGPRAAALAELAGDLGVWLVPGTLCERGPEGVSNTAVVFSPEGALAAVYRKCFPWRPHETFVPGSDFTVVDLPGIGRAGLSICYDSWFPEVARQLAWQGAEFVITPTRTTTSDRAQELVLSRANAIVNQIYVLSVNAAAPGVGQSLVVDPEGRVRVDAGRAPEVLTDVIDLDDVTRVREYGTAGLNRMWHQHRDGDPVLELPVYQGRMWTRRNS